LGTSDEISYLREYEHLTLARALVAQYEQERDDRVIRDALGLLERLLQSAEAGQRTGIIIEIRMVQALAFAAAGDSSCALESLERALTLAEPEGYVRLFVGEGEPMRNLLRQAATKDIVTAYTRRLLASFDEPVRPISAPASVASTALAEPLTAREGEILRLIAAGMRNEQIADQLFISLATVKRHIANAYGKLGVSHRTEAVAKARDLGLL
jgi:LuxR family maltose regulon positive regulatory protein